MTTTTEPTNLLREVQDKDGITERRTGDHEERPARDKGVVPGLRHQEVSDRPLGQRLRRHRGSTRWRRKLN